jgi:hypothetical protein
MRAIARSPFPTDVPLQDSWGGVYPRWHVSFNITMLRLVSFSIDYHWACKHIGIADVRRPPARFPSCEFMGLTRSDHSLEAR